MLTHISLYDTFCCLHHRRCTDGETPREDRAGIHIISKVASAFFFELILSQDSCDHLNESEEYFLNA